MWLRSIKLFKNQHGILRFANKQKVSLKKFKIYYMYLHLPGTSYARLVSKIYCAFQYTSKIKAYMYYMKLRITTWYVYIGIHYDIQIFTI